MWVSERRSFGSSTCALVLSTHGLSSLSNHLKLDFLQSMAKYGKYGNCSRPGSPTCLFRSTGASNVCTHT